MSQIRRTPGAGQASGGSSKTFAAVNDIVQPGTPDEQWSQLCQWHYELGWIAGYAQARADADAELVGALAAALGGPNETDYGKALKAHERMTEQAKLRREWDAHAAEPRPGDFPGGAALPPTYLRAPEQRPGDYPGKRAA